MDTGNQVNNQSQVNATANEPATEPAKDVFTQEDVNRIVAKRVAKYSDYEDLKAKADEYDKMQEANKTELQKATERANGLQAELDALKKAAELRDIRDAVAEEKNVPANLLTGNTQEECEAQAEQLLSFASKHQGYPAVKDGGEPASNFKKATRDQFAEWLNSID